MNLTKKQLQMLCGGRFITLKYIKKDDTECQINGRIGVIKHIKGTGNKSPRNDMITFYKNNTGYRSLYINKIKEIHFNGQTLS